MKILFLGDLFYDYNEKKEDIEKICKYIREKNYHVIVNLETTLPSAEKAIKKRGPNLQSTNLLISLLKEMNCIGVCLANNHAMDYGEKALLEMIQKLEREGIFCVGAGRDLDKAKEAVCINLDGQEVIIQNYGWNIEETVYATIANAGCAPLIRSEIISKTQKIKAERPDSILINIFHWGFEFNVLPMPLDIRFSHDCVEAGADLIIGHHPHVIQPFEIYQDVPIYYSLGNFYFASRRDLFDIKYIRECKVNYGDYGLGVVYDTETRQHRHIYFLYNRVTKETLCLEDIKEKILTNLCAWEYFGEKYKSIAKKHAYKNNPILSLDDRENRKELRHLMNRYWIAGKIQFLKKSKLGGKIYACLKKV